MSDICNWVITNGPKKGLYCSEIKEEDKPFCILHYWKKSVERCEYVDNNTICNRIVKNGFKCCFRHEKMENIESNKPLCIECKERTITEGSEYCKDHKSSNINSRCIYMYSFRENNILCKHETTKNSEYCYLHKKKVAIEITLKHFKNIKFRIGFNKCTKTDDSLNFICEEPIYELLYCAKHTN